MLLSDPRPTSLLQQHRSSKLPGKPTCRARSRTPYSIVARPGQQQQYICLLAASATAAPKEKQKLTVEQQLLLKQILNYSYEVETDDGKLVVEVMREDLLPRCADLLADTFVDTKGIQAYRRYVRRNILTYLEQHHKMPPSAVVLTAVLHSTVPVGAESDSLMLEGSLPELSPSSSSSNSSSSTVRSTAGSSSAVAAVGADSKHVSSSSSRRNWWVQKPAIESTSSSSSSSSQTTPSSDSSTGQSSSSSSNGIDSIDVAASFSSSTSSKSIPVQGSSSSSSSSSSSEGISSFVGNVVQQLASGLGLQQQQQQQQTRIVQQLVGVAEVSFKESTRSSYLTLNPPRKCAYLCNMAVSNECRRKGVATHLIAAIEDMCNLAGESDVYLHLRVKDEATAGGLYYKAGFRPFKKDWPVLLLLGQEPRYLMRKQLPTPRALVGRVVLPAQQQGDGEQQQQQGVAGGSVEQEQQAAAVEVTASSAA